MRNILNTIDIAVCICGSHIIGIVPVSYTHLDVYKRQILDNLTFLVNNGGMKAEDVKPICQEFCSWAKEGYSILVVNHTPVSYTHLDVYKRQEDTLTLCVPPVAGTDMESVSMEKAYSHVITPAS